MEPKKGKEKVKQVKVSVVVQNENKEILQARCRDIYMRGIAILMRGGSYCVTVPAIVKGVLWPQ